MKKLIILNTRDVKKINEIVKTSFGVSLPSDYAYLQNDKGKIFIVNKDLAKIDTTKLYIDRIGLYFAEQKDDRFRLSKEGAQFLAAKTEEKIQNITDLEEDEVKRYFKGEDITKDLGEQNKAILLRYQKDILGFAIYKEGIILNHLPKAYRGEVVL